MGKINVLVIHGVGDQDFSFDKGMRKELEKRLGSARDQVMWNKVHWADLIEPQERALHSDTMATGMVDQNRLRRFLLSTAGDALSYRHSGHEGKKIYDQIHDLVGRQVKAMQEQSPEAPVVILAHSLGAQIMSDYIWDRQHEKKSHADRPPIQGLVSMITFGCNIPLFAMAANPPKPIVLPDPAARTDVTSVWRNYFDPDDLLGWPLIPLYERHAVHFTDAERQTLERIEDIPINTGWLLSSHLGYWTDNSLTVPVAKYLGELISES